MNRVEQTENRRRRRQSSGLNNTNLRLYVDEKHLDTDNFAYRFVNNDADRIRRLTIQDDWEVVTDRNNAIRESDGMGSTIEVSAGIDDTGKANRVVLLRKPKKYYNDDFAEAQAKVDATETMIREGANPQAQHSHSYTPDEGVKVGRLE